MTYILDQDDLKEIIYILDEYIINLKELYGSRFSSICYENKLRDKLSAFASHIGSNGCFKADSNCT